MSIILSLTVDYKYGSLFSLVSIPFLVLHKADGAQIKMDDPRKYVDRVSKGFRIVDTYTLFEGCIATVGNDRCHLGRNVNEEKEITPEEGTCIPSNMIFTYLENKNEGFFG